MNSNTENKPKILSQNTLLESRYFRINQVVVERGGKQFTKDFVVRNSAVYVVALTEANEIYLVSQTRDALQKVTLELIAGTTDQATHDPFETAKRELHEEAGLTAKTWKKLPTFHLSANMVSDIHVFLATDIVEGTAHPDSDEDIAVVKIPFDDAIAKVLNGEINIAANVAILLFVNALKKAGKL